MYFDPKEVGKRIAKLRELLGYNQEQYSQKINISRSALSKIEIGDRSPSIDLLIEIAELSGVTLDYLILGRTPQEGNKKLGMQLVISFLTELEKRVIKTGITIFLSANMFLQILASLLDLHTLYD